MKERIEQIKQKTLEEIKKVTDLKNLEEIKVKALGINLISPNLLIILDTVISSS